MEQLLLLRKGEERIFLSSPLFRKSLVKNHEYTNRANQALCEMAPNLLSKIKRYSIIQLMDSFEQNGHKLINSDVFEGLNLVANSSIDLIFLDPPYNIGKNFNTTRDKWKTNEDYLNWSYKWIDLCIEKLKNVGSLYIMASTQFMPYFDIYIRRKMTILSRIVWYYDSSGVQAKKYFGSLYEPILFCVKNEKTYCFNADAILVEAKTGAKRKLIDYRKSIPVQYNSTKIPGNVWEFPRVRYRMDEYENHPSQKPIALLERIIKASSNKGDIILDPFSGTFTTAYVCKELERKSIGIEIDNDYYKIGLRRVFDIDEYKGKSIRRNPKIYESSIGCEQLTLFEKAAYHG